MSKLLPKSAKSGRNRSGEQPAGLAFVEGVSASMRPVEAVIRELAQRDVPVLVLAEPGAGKHATAQRIHQMSQRTEQSFRWFQCLGLEPVDLDVLREREGTDLGTIYLEELADLSAECQARLLDALPQSSGSSAVCGERARLICGSARDLEVEVKRGRLREDLYYRISGVCLRLPPLRQRKEDIPFLMGYFLRKYARDFGRRVPDLSAQTLRLFLDYSWPGNLRELEDAARVLVALGDEDVALGGLRAVMRKPEAGSNGAGVSLKAASKAASREAEKELILNTLTRTRWNRRRAAEQLQISYKALLYKLKQIGFDGTEPRSSAETL
ncbi:MAG TPA: sigma 54-interacting transcriptional regulator [Candidatus Sulfotelmatobacter sp.]|nr:sigma 54-interacting transcriptional regulator [Candidatus Sulfotelmatobacter sp.]